MQSGATPRRSRRIRAYAAFLSVVASVAAVTVPTLPATARDVLRYALHTRALPAGYGLRVEPNRYAIAVRPDIALAENGTCAAAVADLGDPYQARKLVVWSADGSRRVIGMPPDFVMLRAFRHPMTGTVDGRPFPDTEFRRVALAADGTPFVTIVNHWSGGAMGMDKAVFRFTRGRRVVVRGFGTRDGRGTGPTDYEVAAAELPRLRLALTADYTGNLFSSTAFQSDLNYDLPQAWILAGGGVRKLGAGVASGMAGSFLSGYIGVWRGRPVPNGMIIEPQMPIALLWNGNRRLRLGRGVAFAVNRSGVAVGDDRASVYQPGRPTMWTARGPVALSQRGGTAFAVADDGTIAGTFADGGGFVVRGGELQPLDPAVVRGAYVAGAFGINGRGRILVETSGDGGRGLAVLDPAR